MTKLDRSTLDMASVARDVRVNILTAIGNLGVGHIGGCLSLAEVLTVLYTKHMNIDPSSPKMEGRDRLVVSKGHAGPAVYAILARMGYFDKELLLTLNQGGSCLPSHCDMNKTVGIDMTTGSLGQGFSAAVGVAIGAKLSKDNARVFTIIGDGESQEGQIWEAAMYASQAKLNNLIAFTDYNKMQIDGDVDDVNSLHPLDAKWRAFNWNVIVINGHDLDAIDRAISLAKGSESSPTMIILDTVKGKGVKYIEKTGFGNHSMSMTKEQMIASIEEVIANA